MDNKKELKLRYKATKTTAGVFQIKNTKNNKVFIKSSRNLKTMTGQQFQLEHNSHPIKQLQEDWNMYGKDAFVIEVLEELKQKEDDYTDPKDALKKLEVKWLEQLQPFGDRGYNRIPERGDLS